LFTAQVLAGMVVPPATSFAAAVTKSHLHFASGARNLALSMTSARQQH